MRGVHLGRHRAGRVSCAGNRLRQDAGAWRGGPNAPLPPIVASFRRLVSPSRSSLRATGGRRSKTMRQQGAGAALRHRRPVGASPLAASPCTVARRLFRPALRPGAAPVAVLRHGDGERCSQVHSRQMKRSGRSHRHREEPARPRRRDPPRTAHPGQSPLWFAFVTLWHTGPEADRTETQRSPNRHARR